MLLELAGFGEEFGWWDAVGFVVGVVRSFDSELSGEFLLGESEGFSDGFELLGGVWREVVGVVVWWHVDILPQKSRAGVDLVVNMCLLYK